MHATLRPTATGAPTRNAPSQTLRNAFAAVRVSFTWLGVRKTLNSDQKAQAAESFGAEGHYLSAAKKLLDTGHTAFKPVTALRHSATSYWKGCSLPYPEPGVRLIRHHDVEVFDHKMKIFKDDLDRAVENLNNHFHDLQSAAQQRLGTLYNAGDYPASLAGMFGMEWDFPSIEPPEYLLRLNPNLYQQERQRIAARFDEAVKLAEEAFTGEFSKLVGHLVERLSTGVDGDRKIFRDSALTNLTEFFDRFRKLNVNSNADLDALVDTARKTLEGVDPQAVRDSEGLRQQINTQLATVQSALDGMLVDQPRRRILRVQQKGGE